MKKHAVALAAACAMGAAGYYAFAQDQDSAAGDKIRADLQDAALTRPAARPTPIGAPAGEVADGRINWTEMRTSLAISARRDLSAQQTTSTRAARPAGVRAMAVEGLKNVQAREVNVTQLPVLAPDTPRIQQTLKVWSLGDSYSATAEVDDTVAMRISGARKKIVVGDVKSARTRVAAMRAEQKTLPGLDTPYVIGRSESSTDLSFSKFGAGYVLSLICDDPEGDPRCADDAFIVSLASNMLVLNPTAGGE